MYNLAITHTKKSMNHLEFLEYVLKCKVVKLYLKVLAVQDL